MGILMQIAPMIATALGGPLAGLAVGFISKHFGIDPDKVQAAVAGMSGDDLVKMKGLDLQFQAEMAELGIKIDMAQIGVDQAEATNTNWFVAGWRPFVGWVCGSAFAYAFVIVPILDWGVAVFGSSQLLAQINQLPKLDLATMMPVLLGMLGLGGLRTVEKVQNAEGNR